MLTYTNSLNSGTERLVVQVRQLVQVQVCETYTLLIDTELYVDAYLHQLTELKNRKAHSSGTSARTGTGTGT